MTYPHAQRVSMTFAAVAALALSACGGGGSSGGTVQLPQLSPASPSAFLGTCEQLADRLGSLPDTAITGSSFQAAGTVVVAGQPSPVPDHCLVSGRMFDRVSPVDGQAYAIGFEMRLPVNWNGRFYHQGNGGIDGSVSTAIGASGGGPLTNALHKGFAVLSSNAGHDGTRGPFFGLDPQARLDYGYQAVAKLTPMAREVLATAYGREPDRSYFGGCSNGGRHAMIAATRYADQYDGILVGAPGYRLPRAALANIAGGQLYASVATDPTDLATGFTADERLLLSNAVLARCDALDGVTDGMVQDTTACQAQFNLETDVPTCAGDRDGSCLSAAQKSALAQIFAGPRTASGELIYSSFPYDPGIAGGDIGFWEFFAPLVLDSGAVGAIFQVPPADPATFNGPMFALTADLDALLQRIHATDATYTEDSMSFMTPPNPTDMSTLRDRGGKILVYHGVADAIFSVDDTQAWYDGLRAADDRAAEYARFFRVPGMNHCSGGLSTDRFDALESLVSWVEQGQAPDRIIATARGAGAPPSVNPNVPADWAAERSRPLCPYPAVARYSGSGDVESADSFVCE